MWERLGRRGWARCARLVAAGHPTRAGGTSVLVMDAIRSLPLRPPSAVLPSVDVDAVVTRLFLDEGASLVRLARFFVDDRTAAEDLVQEAFIRFARAARRLRSADAAPAYLRSIVLNLARDHNRRGLLSLRHHLPESPPGPSVEDEVFATEERRRVVEALRDLPVRQRDAVVLRYFLELPVAEIAATMGISVNSVKTHLKRGLAALEVRLGGGR